MNTASKMRPEFLLLILVFWIKSCACIDHQYLNSSRPKSNEEVPIIITEEESSQELSLQLQDVEIRANNGWTVWSEWSACSRSCDGGVSHQLRRCKSAGCRGEHVRYKICNMQPCPDSHEFREDQCSAFNSQPYEGLHYDWQPHYDDIEPCTLVCRGRPLEMPADADEESMTVIARLSDKVQDGTRCRPGNLDMCIDGKCQRIGCDLRIGSNKQIDACGVCGGDGSSCARPLYHWTLATLSLCSVTCGGGYKMSRPVCKNRVTGDEIEEQLCNAVQKPNSAVVPCNSNPCPPKWHVKEWGPCSASCGGGSRIRGVHCVEEANNTKIRINELKCGGHKPRFQEACNQMDCPKWHASQWSGCSVSCGEGVRVRVVECRDHNDQISDLCDPDVKLSSSKACSTGIQCPFHIDDHNDELLPGLYHTQPLIRPYPPPAPAHAERLVGEPSDSTFIPDEWGPCSVTCGEGVRRRGVHCKIFLEFSRTIAKMPDHQCSGSKPPETEKCFLEPCSSERIDIKDDPFLDANIKVAPGTPGKSYSWRENGYTACSATCLGGVQELMVNCVRDDTQKVAAPYLCQREIKPEILIRTCNDHPCPPRWNFSDFQPCSQSCGIGIQTREVNCIHEVTQGGGNTVVVPNNMCPQPPPLDRQYCNVLDCPVKWRVGDWSKCSKICGGGEKTRKVECKQVMAQNHTVDRPHTLCPTPKPQDRKPCNTKSCVLDTDKPIIETSNTTFIQHDAKKKKISLKVGGAATVYHGTTIKIKCPVKRFNRTKIQWAKDHNYLPKSKKYKTSKKGALRVTNLTYRDSGVYTCVAGRSSADLTLSVRPKPGEFINSEEVQRQAGYRTDRIDLEISDVHPEREDMNPIFDDHSHERRPDMPKKPKKVKPTVTSKTDLNSLNGWMMYTTTPKSEGEQQLWPFQTFSNSRGHRMVAFPDDHLLSEQRDDEEDDEEEEEESVVVLGKGLPDQLKFEWIVTDWSRCSESCGGNGYQMRAAHCMVRLHNKTQGVENNLCEDAGIEAPDTIRRCGMDECPKWLAGPWIPCEQSKCFARNTAMQRREVKCKLGMNVTLDGSKCNFKERPIHRQECRSEKCVGKWKAGSWSKCSAPCDSQGVKYRILQCMWYGTKKPAGSACRDSPRPTVMKACKGRPCESIEAECKDHSMFCPNVKVMNMCRLSRYQQQCCLTCAAG